MSLEAGRVGVRNDQVDAYGRINANDTFIDDIIRDLPGWTDMPVWRGGTEAILPENDDEPETSPILADIQYPDALRNNQYFLYRESPANVDGKAKIRRIQGNTLVWNQLVQNGNFANLDNWSAEEGVSFTVSNNIATYSTTIASNGIAQLMPYISGHKYYLRIKAKSSVSDRTLRIVFRTSGMGYIAHTFTTTDWEVISGFLTPTETLTRNLYLYEYTNTEAVFNLQDFICIDLTQMGLDDLTLEQFEAWLSAYYPLPYYAYTSGKLLPFKGEELKTTGRNQFDKSVASYKNGYVKNDSGTEVDNALAGYTTTYIRVLPNTVYNISGSICDENVYARIYYYDGNKQWLSRSSGYSSTPFTFTTPDNCEYIQLQYSVSPFNADTVIISLSSLSDYEPYTSYTNNLPTLDFFPTGMKSAGSVYDELLPDKAITRVGVVDLGTLDWGTSGGYRFGAVMPSDALIDSDYTIQRNSVCGDGYQWYSGDILYNNDVKGYSYYIEGGTNKIFMKNTSYSSASDFKASLSGVYLYYELVEPIIEPTIIIE